MERYSPHQNDRKTAERSVREKATEFLQAKVT